MSANNRILFIAPSAYSLGGVQTWLDYLLPGLDARGYKTTIALPNNSENLAQKYLDQHPCDSVHYLKTRTGTVIERISAIEKSIRSIDPAIIVVVNIYDAYPAINNLRKRNASSARIVTTIHGIQEDLLTGIKVNANIIDAVISTNRLTQNLVTQFTGVDAGRSLYAPYGVNELIVNKPPDSDSFTIAYVGRIEEQQKCVHDLLAIFSKLLREIDKVTILIAGGGPDLPVLKEWLEIESQYASQISYLGIIEAEKVSEEIYAKADALLLTSRWETGPIVAWEAMRCNVTLVSSRYIGSLEEGSLIDGENCLLFDIGDIDNAVKKVKQSTNVALREQLNSEALSLVRSKYSIKRSVDTWADCFDNINMSSPKPYAPNTIQIKDKGRLATIFKRLFGDHGESFAEHLRLLFALTKRGHSENIKWPHSYDSSKIKLINLDKYFRNRDQ